MRPSAPVRQAFIAGVAAGGLTLLAGIAGRYLLALPSVPELAASLFTRLTPTDTFGTLLVSFRYFGRVLLLITIVIGSLAAFGMLGIIARRSREWRFSDGIPGLRRESGLNGAVPVVAIGLAVLVGFALAIVLLPASGLRLGGELLVWFLIQGAVFSAAYYRSFSEPLSSQASAGPTRRQFVENMGLAAVGLVLGVAVLKGLRDLGRDYFSATPTGRVGPSGHLSEQITPNRSFYVVSKNLLGDPDLSSDVWQLQLRGRQSVALSYQSLVSLPMTTQIQTLECISNEVGGDLISTASWEGVALRDLLTRVGIRPGDREVVFKAADGYSESLPLDIATDPATLLAMRMNGKPLPKEHGFPARLLIPGRYGMKNIKWVSEVELNGSAYDGYWEQRGWSKTAVAKTMARFDIPAIGSPLHERPVRLGGIAYAGSRGISKVEVETDNVWTAASVDPPLSPFAWAIWRMDWEPTRTGRQRLRVRAIDGRGSVQEAGMELPIPHGATGYHTIEVEVA